LPLRIGEGKVNLFHGDCLELMPYISGLGIPYMGSKRKLAPKIVDFILAENPQAKYVFDLFGGGGDSFYSVRWTLRRF